MNWPQRSRLHLGGLEPETLRASKLRSPWPPCHPGVKFTSMLTTQVNSSTSFHNSYKSWKSLAHNSISCFHSFSLSKHGNWKGFGSTCLNSCDLCSFGYGSFNRSLLAVAVTGSCSCSSFSFCCHLPSFGHVNTVCLPGLPIPIPPCPFPLVSVFSFQTFSVFCFILFMSVAISFVFCCV